MTYEMTEEAEFKGIVLRIKKEAKQGWCALIPDLSVNGQAIGK